MNSKQNNWTAMVPVYVTRKNTQGETGTFTVVGWVVVLMEILIGLNVIGWGVVGLVEIARYFA